MSLEQELGNQSLQIESLTEEKLRLLREVASLKASGGKITEDANGVSSAEGYYFTSPAVSTSTASSSSLAANASKSKSAASAISGDQLVPKFSSGGNTTISNVGALRLYEFLLGIFFIAAMLNYIFV